MRAAFVVLILLAARPTLADTRHKTDGSFTSAATIATAPSGANTVIVADLDGDKDLDAIVGNQVTSGVVVYWGPLNGTTITSQTVNATNSQAAALVAADFNNDGVLDFASANRGPGNSVPGSLTVFLNHGSRTFTTTDIPFPSTSRPYALDVADFNEDGWLDFAVATRYGSSDGAYIAISSTP